MPVRVDVYHASFGSQDNCNSEETNSCVTCLSTKHKNKLVFSVLPQGEIRVLVSQNPVPLCISFLWTKSHIKNLKKKKKKKP
jgi:hypothetical protein